MNSTCIITNDNYIVYAKQDFAEEDFEITPHAPIQALILARKEDVDGGVMYIDEFPCHICAKAVAAAGIKKVVYKQMTAKSDTQTKAKEIFEKANIEIIQNTDMEI